MKLNLLLLTIILIFPEVLEGASTGPDSMQLLNELQIINNNDGTSSVGIICRAWVGTCKFNFITVPPGWIPQGNMLRAPSSEINSVRSFALKVNVT